MAGKPVPQNQGIVTSLGGNLPRYEDNSAVLRQAKRGEDHEKSKMDAVTDPAIQLANLKDRFAGLTKQFESANKTVKDLTEQLVNLKKQLVNLKKTKTKAKGAKVDKAFGTEKDPKEEKIVIGDLKNPPAMAKPIAKDDAEEDACDCGEKDCDCKNGDKEDDKTTN
jgi:chromosome segregation ATPase